MRATTNMPMKAATAPPPDLNPANYWLNMEPAVRNYGRTIAPLQLYREEQLQADAERYRLQATPWPIAVDDVRKVLSAGCPVHVSMNTGSGIFRCRPRRCLQCSRGGCREDTAVTPC